MTLEEKLAAVQCGDVGSYNFARPVDGGRDSDFQMLVKQALAIARSRGYFCRVEGNPDNFVSGLLVTVSDPGEAGNA